jgi:TolB-like protein/Tfp pilus assembly protein PilF
VRFLFDNHILDTDTRELLRDDSAIAIQPQVFDLLTYLVQNCDHVVSKDDLLTHVWGGRTVADSTLATHINAARKAVGDNGEEQRLIRTVPRKGIRFIGNVSFPPDGKGSARVAEESPRRSRRSALPSPERPAIAVLPFVNMSGEAQQEYFSDGISEDIITALSKLRWFFVIARNSTFTYKGKAVHIKQIASELGVGYVVEGSVRKDGDRVRITAQLIDTTTGSHIWADRYDRDLADVFSVQDEITDAIAARIEPQLYAAENFRARRKPPESLDAWDLVMRALRHFWRMTREDNLEAQALLEQAIAIDPNYGQALAVLVVSHIFGAQMGWEDAAIITPVAEKIAMKALRADGDDPWAHLALAFAYARGPRIADSLAAFETTLRLNPNFSLALGSYGLVLTWDGRSREGAEAAHRALRLSPRDPSAAIFYGIAAYAAYVERDYIESIALCRKSIRLRSDFVAGWRVMTAAAGMAGDTKLAAEALEGYRRTLPGVTLARAEVQLPVRDQGERAHFMEGLRRAGLE